MPNTPLMLNSSYDGSSTLDLGGFLGATVASLSAAGTGSAVMGSTGSTGMLTVNYQGSTPMVYSGALGGGPATQQLRLCHDGKRGGRAGRLEHLHARHNHRPRRNAATLAKPTAMEISSGCVPSNNGSLVLNLANVSVFGGAISGTGSVTLMGNTTADLTGPGSNYSGATFIQNGTLVASGSAASTNPLFARDSPVVLGDTSNNSGILQFWETDNSGPVNQTVTGLSRGGTGYNNSVIGGNSSVSTPRVNLASNSAPYSGNRAATAPKTISPWRRAARPSSTFTGAEHISRCHDGQRGLSWRPGGLRP